MAVDVTPSDGGPPPGETHAGDRPAFSLPWLDLTCCSCGYSVVVRLAPVRCPRCGGAGWQLATAA